MLSPILQQLLQQRHAEMRPRLMIIDKGCSFGLLVSRLNERTALCVYLDEQGDIQDEACDSQREEQ